MEDPFETRRNVPPAIDPLAVAYRSGMPRRMARRMAYSHLDPDFPFDRFSEALDRVETGLKKAERDFERGFDDPLMVASVALFIVGLGLMGFGFFRAVTISADTLAYGTFLVGTILEAAPAAHAWHRMLAWKRTRARIRPDAIVVLEGRREGRLADLDERLVRRIEMVAEGV